MAANSRCLAKRRTQKNAGKQPGKKLASIFPTGQLIQRSNVNDGELAGTIQNSGNQQGVYVVLPSEGADQRSSFPAL